MTPMDLAPWIFGAAVVMGLTMFVLRLLTHANPPKALVFLHGLGVLAGVGALVYATFTGPHPTRPGMALLLVAVAGTAGVYLAFVDHKRELVPADQIAVHGGLAAAAFLATVSLSLTF